MINQPGRFFEGPRADGYMVELLWRHWETRRLTEKTNLNLRHVVKPVNSTQINMGKTMPTVAHQELCSRMMVPGSERLARIWEMLCDETDAKLLLAMPGTAGSLPKNAHCRSMRPQGGWTNCISRAWYSSLKSRKGPFFACLGISSSFTMRPSNGLMRPKHITTSGAGSWPTNTLHG